MISLLEMVPNQRSCLPSETSMIYIYIYIYIYIIQTHHCPKSGAMLSKPLLDLKNTHNINAFSGCFFHTIC